MHWLRRWIIPVESNATLRAKGVPEDRPFTDIDLAPLTPFQQRVLREVVAIPRGQTCTYGELAERVGAPRAARAVGSALARNPVPLLIRSKYTTGEGVPEFSERAFRGGALGSLAAQNVMLLAMAHAGKLNKYGP